MSCLSYVVLAVLVMSVSCQAPTVYYFCTENGSVRRLEFYVREDTADVTHVQAYEVSSNTSLDFACDSTGAIPFVNSRTEINGVGTAANPFHLSVSINTQTDTLDPPCGYQSTSPSVYRFILETTSTPTGSWDQQNVITCDFLNSAAVQGPNVQASVTVTQEPATAVVKLKDAYSYEVLDSNQQPFTAIDSNIVILKANFLSGAGIAPPVVDAIGISPHTCKVCDVQDCSGNYVLSMTDSNGCPINHFFYGHGFQGDGVTLLTAEAYLPNLHNYNYVYLVCINDYCTSTSGMSKCQDRCGALNGRKRRDVDNVQNKKSSYSWTRQNLADFYGKQINCDRRYGVVMATLIAILNISIIVSIIQCNYLFKSKSKSEKSAELYTATTIQHEKNQQLLNTQ